MYTVCWTEYDKKTGEVRDFWDRCATKCGVRELLKIKGLEQDEDVLIFSVGADSYLLSPQEVLG